MKKEKTLQRKTETMTYCSIASVYTSAYEWCVGVVPPTRNSWHFTQQSKQLNSLFQTVHQMKRVCQEKLNLSNTRWINYLYFLLYSKTKTYLYLGVSRRWSSNKTWATSIMILHPGTVVWVANRLQRLQNNPY